jgi:HEAT repeat protein
MQRYLSALLLIFVVCGVSPKQKALDILDRGINDASVIVRVQAAKALGQAGDEQGIELLYEITRGEDQEGCAAALRALSGLPGGSYSPEIARHALEGDVSVRIEAYKLIASMEDEECRAVLIKGTYDKSGQIRRISYLGLESFKENDIIRGGLRDIDPLVRIAAAQSLGHLGEPEMADFVRNELNAAKSDVWKHGIIALAELGDTSSIPDIKGYLCTAPWEVRLAAVEALLILNNHDGVLVLQEVLQADDPFAREYATYILKKYEIADAEQLLRDVVRDEYTNISVAAIEALAQYRSQEQQRLFEEMMNTPNPLVQIAAAAAYLQGE